MEKVIKFLRKVYSKKGSNSLIMNIPMEIARKYNIVQGDYIHICEIDGEIILRKVETYE